MPRAATIAQADLARVIRAVGDEGIQQFPKSPHETHVLGKTASVDSKGGICAPPEGNASPATLADTGQDQGQSAIAGANPSRDIPQASAVAPTIAALFVETGGSYYGLPGVDPWDEARDARTYAGPYPVVAHSPCQRWGKLWAGQPLWIKRTGQRKVKGDDGGCFAAALEIVRKFGGVIEHPCQSHAWKHFGLATPPRTGGWIKADDQGGWTCCVEQGRYGHYARKPTWLLVYNCELPELDWGIGESRLDPAVIERLGLKRAKRLGEVCSRGGGVDSTPRIGTPAPFRNLLISIARTARPFPATHQP